MWSEYSMTKMFCDICNEEMVNPNDVTDDRWDYDTLGTGRKSMTYEDVVEIAGKKIQIHIHAAPVDPLKDICRACVFLSAKKAI